MSLTRKFLQGMGLTSEQVDAIIDEHSDTVDALKKQRDAYRDDAEELKDAQKELNALKKQVAEDSDGADDWKKKYEDEHKAFEDFKKAENAKATQQAIKEAYTKLLKQNGVSEKFIPSILKVTDYSEMKLDENGELVDADKLSNSIKSDYEGFVTTTGTGGADVDTPPTGSGDKYESKADIMKIKDTTKRQEAIKNNPQLFS